MIQRHKDAVLDENQLAVLSRIEPFTESMTIEVTRGHSNPMEQLEIIERFAHEHGIHFPEFVPGGPVDLKKEVPEVGLVYHWQRTWSRELHIGLTVNPPRSAVCLDDYTRPTGEKMKGKTIQASTHITGEHNGEYPIDFSARVNGKPNITLVANILNHAKEQGAGISFVRIEHKNGCVHAGTEKIEKQK